MPIKDPQNIIAPVVILAVTAWVLFYILSTMSLRKIRKTDPVFYRRLLGELEDSWIDRPWFITNWSDTYVVYRLNKALLGRDYDGPVFIKPNWLTPLIGIISLGSYVIFILLAVEIVIFGPGK